MAVTVGTDVYLSVTDADTYWSNRNNTVWSGATTAQKEKALREATQFIDGAYSFIGTQKTDNVLAWPRFNATVRSGNFAGITYDAYTIPPQVKDATAELALEALSSRLVEVENRGGRVKREKVDVIEIEYSEFAPAGKTYDFVSMILKPVTMGSSTMRRLVRA